MSGHFGWAIVTCALCWMSSVAPSLKMRDLEKTHAATMQWMVDQVHLCFPAVEHAVARRVRRAARVVPTAALLDLSPGVHLLVGEAGLGKSTALRALALSALAAGQGVMALPDPAAYDDIPPEQVSAPD